MILKHLTKLVLASSLLLAGYAMAQELIKIDYFEAQDLNLSKVTQKTFTNYYGLQEAEKEGLEWAKTQDATHYSVFTVERSPKRDRYRVSVVLYHN